MTSKKKRGSKLSHVIERPDLSEWELDTLNEIADLLRDKAAAAATEALDIIMKDNETRAYLGATGTDDQGLGDGHEHDEALRFVDPLDVYIELATSPDGDRNAIYKFNIREDLKERIEECRGDGSYADGLKRIMLAMRELSDEIQDALPSE